MSLFLAIASIEYGSTCHSLGNTNIPSLVHSTIVSLNVHDALQGALHLRLGWVYRLRFTHSLLQYQLVGKELNWNGTRTSLPRRLGPAPSGLGADSGPGMMGYHIALTMPSLFASLCLLCDFNFLC